MYKLYLLITTGTWTRTWTGMGWAFKNNTIALIKSASLFGIKPSAEAY